MTDLVARRPGIVERASLRALLCLYPRRFRAAFGSDMLATYRAARADCATRLDRFSLWARTSLSLARCGVAERSRRGAAVSFSFDSGGDTLMTRLLRILMAIPQDVRLGLRLLGKQRGFTAVAVAILALGIGANTAVFGITNVLLLKPRPGVGDQLVGVFSKDRTQPDSFRAFSYPEYADLRAHTDLFSSLTAQNFAMAGLTENDITRRVFVDVVTGSFFDTFGVPLERGRTFSAAEEKPGAEQPVAVISYDFWQHLGGHDDVVGRTVRVNQRDFVVIGVAPRGFGGSTAVISPEMWLPTGVYDTIANDFTKSGQPLTMADRRHHALILIARLAPGLTSSGAAARLAGVAADMERAYPAESKNQDLVEAPLSRLSVSTSPRTDSELTSVTTVLLLMSGIVLLIASLNLANMLLARGGARRKEFAIRLAIGGSRARLVQQLLTESFMLSLLGGAGGLLVATAALETLTSSLLPSMPIRMTFDTTPDVRVLLATFGFCLLSSLFFGLGPAWKLARTDALPELKDYAGELPGSRRARWFGIAGRDLLVMGQLALSLVLITSAGLFARGAVQAAVADPGFTFDRGILANLDSSLSGNDETRSRQVYRDTLAAVRRQPGVEAVSIGSMMPFGDITMSHGVQRPGAPVKASDPDAKHTLIDSMYTGVTSDYFTSLGLAVRRGREFTGAEELSTDGPRVAIIDEALGRELFGDADPLGAQVQLAAAAEGAPPVIYTIVGIAPPIRHELFSPEPEPHFYVPLGRDFQSNVYLNVKTRLDSASAEAAMLPTLRRVLAGVDPRLPVLTLQTRPMYRSANIMLVILDAGAAIFSTFGIVALLMAAIGVYGVKSYIVARRTREIGIRVALGATPHNVIWMIIREGLTLSVIGLVVGAGLSILAGTGLRGLLYQGGQGQDLAVVAVALATLAGSGLLASWLPALRATRIAPVKALRAE